MRVLVTWGSTRGGTAGIGEILGRELEAQGFEVVAAPVERVRSAEGFDAVILGGALYANRWVPSARRFVRRNLADLRRVPVWFFSSGPLDDSAEREEIPPPTQVAVLAERVGALGHVTFGGRLEPHPKGFAAQAMAKTLSGDWRNPDRIRSWAKAIAAELPHARPGRAVDHPARSLPRLVVHGVFGWALCLASLLALQRLAGTTTALALHAILAPLFFVVVARRYFHAHGARDPLPAAATFAGLFAFLDVSLFAWELWRATEVISFVGMWLPAALIFLASWATGALMSTLPWPTKRAPAPRTSGTRGS
jgi:menaquinone-dependent protoporphyrinogen oxidase